MIMDTIFSSAEKIIRRVEKFTGKRVRNKSRKRDIVDARHISIYLIRNNTSLSYHQIGIYFGHKHHATIIHACKSVEDLLKVDKNYQNQYQKLIDSFN